MMEKGGSDWCFKICTLVQLLVYPRKPANGMEATTMEACTCVSIPSHGVSLNLTEHPRR